VEDGRKGEREEGIGKKEKGKGGREGEGEQGGKTRDIDYDTCSARITIVSPISNA